VGRGVTRATLVWIVAAALVGGLAGVLWVLRSEIGGAHTSAPVVIGAVVLTLIAAALLYHGIMVSAREQDRRSDRVAQRRTEVPPQARPTGRPPQGRPSADDEPLTFRRGKQI
jgi:peptidoglycan/LPS O-acetylase OafA/YrhL